MKRKYIFTAALLAALTAAGFGITVLCGSGGSGSHNKSSGSTQAEGKGDDSDARTEDAAVGNREDGDAAISSKTDGNDTFNVVTSFYPVYIAAKNVIGDVEGAAAITKAAAAPRQRARGMTAMPGQRTQRWETERMAMLQSPAKPMATIHLTW